MKNEQLAYVAGALSMISFFSLVHRVHFTKNTSTLPWYYLVLNISVQILYGIYAITNNLNAIMITSIIFTSGLFYIFFIKFNHPDGSQVDQSKKDLNNHEKFT